MKIGDLSVKYDSTRMFAIFFIYWICLIYALSIGNIFDLYESMREEREAEVKEATRIQNQSEMTDEWVNKLVGPG